MADNTTLPGTGTVVASDDIGGVQYQRVKPVWGVDGVAGDVTAVNPFPTSLNASIFRFSTNNTSVAQLAANATFTGTLETALDQPSVSILLVSDQPITLTIIQTIDAGGTQAVRPIVYYIPAGQGFSASVPLNGNYVQITAKNTGAATTTTFSLNTAYGNLPSSDALGRTPVAGADCIPLLTSTITTASTSAAFDSNGFGSVVVQLSGTWQGNGYFEASNDGVVWSPVLVVGRDSLSLQDVVTSSGIFTIRPSGRYLHFVVTGITGSLTLNAIGRATDGVAASDLLALAMDEANGAPMSTRPRGSANLPMAQDALTGAQVFRPQTTRFSGALSAVGQIFDLPCDDALSVSGYFTQSGVSALSLEVLTPVGWVLATAFAVTSGNGTVNNLITVTATSNVVIALTGTSRLRLRMTSWSSGSLSFTLQTSPVASPLCAATQAGTWTVQPGNTANTTPWLVVPANPATTANNLSSAATTNATSVKASIGNIYNVTASNVGAAAAFLKIYNKASAPTVGTDVPLLTIPIAPSGVVTVDFGVLGFRCATGIAFAITNLAADSDTTAVAAAQVKVMVNYI